MEGLTFAKDILRRTLDMLSVVYGRALSEDDLRDIQIRIRTAEIAIMRNKGEAWLDTQEGREIVGDLDIASTKLLGTAERLQRAGAPAAELLKDFKACLGEIELHIRRMMGKTEAAGER